MEEEKIDFKKIEKKWQKKWEEKKVFEANPDKKNKFFINFPYPYVNGHLHLGHGFSSVRADVMARFKRMRGFNVLFPQGWHCTGTPVWAAAQRIKEGEPKQIQIIKSMGFSEKEISKFSEVQHWIDTFVPAAKEDFSRIGNSVDWRRSFITTSLNSRYDKFIGWQFRKLKEKRLVDTGKHPVVWCPKDNMPVGDHDRVEGEGITTQDFIWGKFRMKNSDLIIMAGTTRPDAFYGQTNLWVDPKGEYSVVKVKKEKWVVGKKVIDKIRSQYEENIEIIKDIKPEELIGKIYKGPVVDYEITALPAWFIDSSIGSGIVYSALEDPVDLFELRKIQEDEGLQKKYGLNKNIVKKLKPIYIITVPGMGENLGEDIGKEFGVKSSKDKEALEKAKGELNRRVFRKGIMRDNCGACAKMSVPECQEYLKKTLTEKGDAVMFYELEGKVVCRCLTPCVVKITTDQWFLKYGDPEWKKITHKALDKMKLYPDLVRQQFTYVLDWLKDWACTHYHGTGTKLPWDEKWVIESLSDSTIYMAYYTIAHLIKEYPEEKINDDFFDFIFLNKGKGDKKMQEMQKEFQYWYPFDIRSSGKDLVQNHLSFCLFNHTAIFQEKYWPLGFSINGWLLVGGDKMSKSKGNFYTIRQMLDKYPADVIRSGLMLGGEGLDDPNFDFSNAENIKQKLQQWYNFAIHNYRAAKKSELSKSDKLFLSSSNSLLKEGTEAMENMMFRTAFDRLIYQMQRVLREYLNKSRANQNLLSAFIEIQTKVLSPFAPFIAEEIWNKLGKKDFISISEWPKVNEKMIDLELEKQEKQIEQTIADLNNIIKLIRQKQNKIVKKAFIYVIPKEFELYNESKERISRLTNMEINIFTVNDKNKYDPQNKAGKAKPGKPAIYLE